MNLHRHVVDVGPFPVSPADIQSDAIWRDAFEHLVQSRDMLLDQLGVFHVGHILEQQHALHRQVGRIDLQHEARVGHSEIFGPNLARDSVEIGFV
jgi:hypothetical protein